MTHKNKLHIPAFVALENIFSTITTDSWCSRYRGTTTWTLQCLSCSLKVVIEICILYHQVTGYYWDWKLNLDNTDRIIHNWILNVLDLETIESGYYYYFFLICIGLKLFCLQNLHLFSKKNLYFLYKVNDSYNSGTQRSCQYHTYTEKTV